MNTGSPPLLEALRALKPNVIFTMADPKTLASASDYYAKGAVRAFRWGASGLLLQVEMDSPGLDPIYVRFTSEDSTLNSVCDCGSRKGCRHVLASAMTLARVLHESKFHRNDLPGAQIEKLRKQLRVTEPDAPAAKVSFIETTPGARFEIDFDTGKRQASWRTDGPPKGMEWLDWQQREPGRVGEAFLAWMKTRPPGLLFEVRTSASDRVYPAPKADRIPGRTQLRVDAGAVVVERAILNETGLPEGDFIDLGYGLVFRPDVEMFALVEPEEAWHAFSRLRGKHLVEHAFHTPAAGFFAEWSLSREAPFVLLDGDGKTVEPMVAGRRPCLSVNLGDGGARIALRGLTEKGREIPSHVGIAKKLESLFEDGPYALLVKSPGRRRRLVELLASLASGEGALGEAGKDSVFVSYQMHGEDAERCLGELLDLLNRWDGEHLLADPAGGTNPWVVSSGAGAAFGRALAAFVRVFPEEDFLRARDCSVKMERDHFLLHLNKLKAVCEELGVDLRMNGGEVRLERLELTIRAARGTEIDWFELHPEARAGALNLPRHLWDEILGAGGYLSDDKTFVAVDPDSLAMLRRMSGMLGPEEETKLHRLWIFDWLSLARDGVRCELPEEDAAVLSSLQTLEGIPACSLPAGLQAELRAYQQHGYEWLAFLYRHRFGACLADDMGLGKTLQAIALLLALKEGAIARQSVSPHLLVLPPTLLFNWQNEISKFAPALKVKEYTGLSRSADFAGVDVVMTTYELARRDMDTLAAKEFDVIIFDEAQAIKNAAAARTQAMSRLKGNFRLCLTGTPLENHVGEFYSIMETAVPGLFGQRRDFVQQFEEGLPIIERARPFLLRRTKEKILSELPPRVEADTWLMLSDRQKEFYTRAVGEVRDEVLAAYEDKPSSQAGIMALAALTRLRQICISPQMVAPEMEAESPKMDYLVEQLTEITQEGHSALVFSQFVKALNIAGTALERAGIPFLRLDGSTPTAKRKQLVEAFQDGEKPAVFLISLKAGGAGLNLTKASYVFHIDPWWNPAVEQQADARAHRMGQKNSVYVQRLLMRHTVEEKMSTLKKRKKALFDAVVNQGEAAGSAGAAALSADDFKFLLEPDAPGTP